MKPKSDVPKLKRPLHPWRMNNPLSPKETSKLPNSQFRIIPR